MANTAKTGVSGQTIENQGSYNAREGYKMWNGSEFVPLASEGYVDSEISGKIKSFGLSLVCDKMNNYIGSERTVATGGVYDTVRTRHQNLTGKTIKSLILVYGNWAPLSGSEINGVNNIQVRASIEKLSPSGVNTQDQNREQAIFGSSFTADIQGGCLAYSQPIPCYIAPNEVFYVRTASTAATTGEKVFRGISALGGTTGFGRDTGEGGNAGSDRVNNAASAISIGVQTAVYSPCAILGETIDNISIPSFAILGDSIAAGVDDAGFAYGYGGWVYRVIEGFPMVYLPISGEKLADVVDLKKFTSRVRVAAHADVIICEYLRNDIEQGQTESQIKANILSFAKVFMLQGKRFIQATCLPAPTSTDGFFTVANQTKQTATKENLRVTINSWLRDNTSSGFVSQAMAQVSGIANAGDAKVIDPCIAIECNISGVLTTDGGYILGSQSGIKATGTATTATATALNDTSKSWTVNEFRGSSIYIVSGVGAGQSRSIGFNTATQIGVGNSFNPVPDATSVYQIFDSLGMNGVHPLSVGHDIIGQSIDALDLLG